MNHTHAKTAAKRRPAATPAQQEAAAARRAAIRTLCGIVKALPVEKRVLLAASYGIRTCEGRELSPFNQCLLVHENSSVSVVGGFRQWQALGRCVKKGVRALAIWIPIGTQKASAEQPDTNPETGEDSRFILGNVFDISQTETDDEKAARLARATLALPAPVLALTEHAQALEVATTVLPNSPADYLADTGESWSTASAPERAAYLADVEAVAPAPSATPSAQTEFTLCD